MKIKYGQSGSGTVCTQNSDCTDNDCRGKCCVSTLNDANCGTCSDIGFCEACATGFSWVTGQGCTADKLRATFS